MGTSLLIQPHGLHIRASLSQGLAAELELENGNNNCIIWNHWHQKSTLECPLSQCQPLPCHAQNSPLEYASFKKTLMLVSYLPAQGLNGQCNRHSVLKRKAHVSRDSPNASRRRMDNVSHYVRNLRSKMLICWEPLSVWHQNLLDRSKNIPYNHESVILPKRKRFRNGWLKPTSSDPEKGGFRIKL